MAKIICGVDVSSFSLEARIGPQGQARASSNTAEGIAELTAFCQQQGAELVAMEATGGYEKQAFALLWARGLPVALLNPRAVRRFAESMGLLEKTDRNNAGVIAWFAAVKRLSACTPASAEQLRLKALVTRLRQLTELQTAQRNQRRLVREATMLASFQEVLALLASQIRTLEMAHCRADCRRSAVAKIGPGFSFHQGRRGSYRGSAHGGDAGDGCRVKQSRL